jgi:hypothetical protein
MLDKDRILAKIDVIGDVHEIITSQIEKRLWA